MTVCAEPHPLEDPTIARFMACVEITPDGHWLWRKYLEKNGYAKFWFNGKMEWAHRVAYILFKRVKLRNGYDIDHTCFIHHCVNPNCLQQKRADRNRRRRPPGYSVSRGSRRSSKDMQCRESTPSD